MNQFLDKLLNLQQDGSGAISAPTNWCEPPLLEIETELESQVAEIASTGLLGPNRQTKGRWLFLVGSPGNGKSAAVGKLARLLTTEKNATLSVVTAEGRIGIDELERGTIPYLIEVSEAGNRFSSLWIAQDASVVKDPFGSDLDPAKDLLQLLRDAWSKGVSLVVCTNRGVIERAYRDGNRDAIYKDTAWFRAIRHVITRGAGPLQLGSTEGKKTVFPELEFSYVTLDVNSLLIENDLFSKLLQNATACENWQVCSYCPHGELCPFLQNRQWLVSERGREVLLDVLRKAELFSGQIIVFREALALVSYLLAGCTRDYTGINPCQWVAQCVKQVDIFSLASRRFYMGLFSSSNPHGLETDTAQLKLQLEALKSLLENAPSCPSTDALRHVVTSNHKPSIDVGLQRLIGTSGVLARLDPLNLAFEQDFYDIWDADLENILVSASDRLGGLERRCLEVWQHLELLAESSKDVLQVYRHLRRWITSYTIRLGALVDNSRTHKIAFDHELGCLLEIIRLSTSNPTGEDLAKFDSLQSQLRELVFAGSGGKIKLSDNVSLAGNWVNKNLAPRIRRETEVKNLGLVVNVGEDNEDLAVVINAETYSWLYLKLSSGLSPCCFPAELLESVEDAQSMAACRGQYAYQDEEIEIHVQIPSQGNSIEKILKRVMGNVIYGN